MGESRKSKKKRPGTKKKREGAGKSRKRKRGEKKVEEAEAETAGRGVNYPDRDLLYRNPTLEEIMW